MRVTNSTTRQRPVSRAVLRGTFGLLTATLTATLAVAALAVPAQAGDTGKPVTEARPSTGPVPGGFASWTDLFGYQQRLNQAATAITNAGGEGYAGIVAAPDQHRLSVYWKGAIPVAARQAAATAGVPVEFHGAAYTQRQMFAEATRLAADPRVASAAPKVDGTGLSITTLAGVTPAARGAGLLGTATMPVSVTPGQRPAATFDRQHDTPLFWGGSRYDTPLGGCTNGFALSIPGFPNGYELSAAHCGDNGQAATIPGQESQPGTVFADQNGRDTMAIAYAGTGVAGRIYRGARDSSTSSAVGGAAADFVGNLVCTDGSNSGEHCGVRVQQVDAVVNSDVGQLSPQIIAALPAGQCAVAHGDSGGPVFAGRSDGKVDARGTISTGGGSATCPGTAPAGFSTVSYAPMLRPAGDAQVGSLQFYGVGVLTT